MILRVRSRDGLERVSVSDAASVGALTAAVREQLKLAEGEPAVLSRDSRVLLAKSTDLQNFKDFADPSASLAGLGLRHGDVVYLWYPQERQVEKPKVPVVPAGSFGKKMTVEDLLARQIRIERQEQAHCELLSFDRNAANQFQLYVSDTLGFSVQRGGFMYGSCTKEGEVQVEFIYEPPQSGTEDSLLLHRNQAEEQCVEAIAAGLGLQRVGFIFAQTAAQAGDTDRNFILSTDEIRLAAELHAEALGLLPKKAAGGGGKTQQQQDDEMADAATAAGGNAGQSGNEGEGSGFKQFCIGVVKLDSNEDGEPVVHFEAYQLSDQCVKLYAEGLFEDKAEPVADGEGKGEAGPGGKGVAVHPGVTWMKKEVIVLRKDTFEVDNDFFLVNVKISDHEGFLRTSFPIENRVIATTEKDLHNFMEKSRSIAPFSKRLADFHLLLFLSHILDPTNDLPVIAEAVRLGVPIPEGYQLIIESF